MKEQRVGVEQKDYCIVGTLHKIIKSTVAPEFDVAYIDILNGYYKICFVSELIYIN